jgi:hypothetical protein
MAGASGQGQPQRDMSFGSEPVHTHDASHDQSTESVLAMKKKGTECFRCHKTGHCINDCKAELCECCQSADHATRDCPILRAPKPRIAVYGVGHVDLTFWKIPLSGDVRPRVENTRLGRVAVEGGIMTIPELIAQLQFLMPDDQYQWDVQQMENNVFKVNFPSRSDLVKAQHFGKFCVPKTQITLSFDFWRKDVEPVWTADEVWVRMYGFPPFALDEILALWAFGDIFGETTDIDLPFTRANNVLRIRLSCLDPALIPASLDVKIRNDFFRLRFEVEGLKAPRANEESLSEDLHKDDDMDHDGPTNNSGDDIDRENKRKKNEEDDDVTDYEPSHPAPSAGNSLSVLPVTVSPQKFTAAVDVSPRYDHVITLPDNAFVLSTPKCLDPFFRAVAVSESAEGILVTSELGMTKLHEPDVVQPLVQRGDCVSEGVDEMSVTPMHGTCTQGTSTVPGARPTVHGTRPGSGNSSIGAPSSRLHGSCSTGVLPGTPIMSSSPVAPSMPNMSPPLRSSPPAMLASQISGPKGNSTTPLQSSKRTVVHMVTPKRSNYTDSPLPGSVHHMVSSSDDRFTVLTDNATIITSPNNCVSQANGGAKKSMTPGTVATPAAKAFSTEEVIAFGGIKSQEARGVRSSGRLRAQPNTDATQLQKAMMLAQRRNENFAQGISQPHSLLNFTDADIIHNATVLGISMGSSLSEQVSEAHKIKENELQRTLTILRKNESVSNKCGDTLPCLIVSRASDLVVDLDDEDHLMDDNGLCSAPVANKIKRNKKKKSYDKNKVRRSNRIRNKNSK